MYRLVLGAVALCLVLSLTGCDQYGTEPTADANVRLVNVSPDAPDLILELAGEALSSATSYAQASEYATVPANQQLSLVVRASGGTVVGQVPLLLRGGTDYSIVAYRSFSDLRMTPLQDLNTPAPDGESHVRLLHIANTLGAVDLYVTAGEVDDISAVTPTIQDLEFEHITSYMPFSAGARRVHITDDGTKDIIHDTGALTFGSTGVYTIYIIENVGGGEPYGVLVVVDALEQ